MACEHKKIKAYIYVDPLNDRAVNQANKPLDKESQWL